MESRRPLTPGPSRASLSSEAEDPDSSSPSSGELSLYLDKSGGQTTYFTSCFVLHGFVRSVIFTTLLPKFGTFSNILIHLFFLFLKYTFN